MYYIGIFNAIKNWVFNIYYIIKLIVLAFMFAS